MGERQGRAAGTVAQSTLVPAVVTVVMTGRNQHGHDVVLRAENTETGTQADGVADGTRGAGGGDGRARRAVPTSTRRRV